VPALSVLDNVFLASSSGAVGAVDRSQRAIFRELAERIGFEHSPGRRVETLRVAEQQKVEIPRARARRAADRDGRATASLSARRRSACSRSRATCAPPA
jgi:ABC-type uncharacterized transport system ATPase subunit